MKPILITASALLLMSWPASAMDHIQGAGGRISDPDARAEHMAAGVQAHGMGHGKPKSRCDVLRDDPYLRAAYGCR